MGEKMQKTIAIVSMLSMIISGISLVPSVSADADTLEQTYWLHPSGTASVTGWTPSPGDGNYSNKLTSNDTNTTYIWSSAVNQNIVLDMEDLAIADVNTSTQYIIVIAHTVFRANFSGAALQMQPVILTSSYQSRYSGVITYNGVWHNYSVTMKVDVYYDSYWQPFKINATQIKYTSMLLGKVAITESVLEVNVYSIGQTDYNYIAIFVLIAALIAVFLIFGVYEYGKT